MTEQTRAQSTQATPVRASDTTAWWTLDTDAVVRSLGTDAANGECGGAGLGELFAFANWGQYQCHRVLNLFES